MSNNIRVMVEYEAPKKDKFLEMLAQYEEIKQTASDTVSYYRPLAEAAEEAKVTAILEQLETIKEYMKVLYNIKKEPFRVYAFGSCSATFDVYYSGDSFKMIWFNSPFKFSTYKACPSQFNADKNPHWNIIGKWDEWKIYEQLEKKCLEMLKTEIDKQKKMAETEKARLANIVGK